MCTFINWFLLLDAFTNKITFHYKQLSTFDFCYQTEKSFRYLFTVFFCVCHGCLCFLCWFSNWLLTMCRQSWGTIPSFLHWRGPRLRLGRLTLSVKDKAIPLGFINKHLGYMKTLAENYLNIGDTWKKLWKTKHTFFCQYTLVSHFFFKNQAKFYINNSSLPFRSMS